MEDNIKREFTKFNKKLDLLFADRDVLTDLVGRVASLEEQLKLNFRHDNEIRKDIKEEIAIANDRTVATIETHTEKVEDIVEKKLDVKPKRSWNIFKRK